MAGLGRLARDGAVHLARQRAWKPAEHHGELGSFFLHDMEDHMTELVRYQCVQCGNKFDVPVLTEKERREAERDRRPVFAIQCPKCSSGQVRKL